MTTTGSSFATPAAICENICSSVPRAAGRRRGVAPPALPEIGDLARPALVLDHDEIVAGERHAVEAQHLDRRRGTGLLLVLAALVDQRAHAAPFAAGDEDVADLQRAALHQHRRDRAAAALELGLEHDALGRAVRVGLQIEQLGLQQDRFLQLVEVGLLERRDLDIEHLAAELLDDELVLQQFLAHPLGLASGRSILLMATMIGTSAALAWRIASTVCSMMPSSAATTSTTMSVTLAPRARIAVKA